MLSASKRLFHIPFFFFLGVALLTDAGAQEFLSHPVYPTDGLEPAYLATGDFNVWSASANAWQTIQGGGGGIPEPTTAGNFLRTGVGTWVAGVPLTGGTLTGALTVPAPFGVDGSNNGTGTASINGGILTLSHPGWATGLNISGGANSAVFAGSVTMRPRY